MKTEVKNNITYLYPDTGKKLKLIDGTDTYSILILAKDDSSDNYEEVDTRLTRTRTGSTRDTIHRTRPGRKDNL